MKRKSLTMILCLLTCLSLVGVGFAAWVITGPAEEDVTGNIVVDSVTDNRYTLTVSPTKEYIVLTGTSGATTGWLTSNTTTPENLDVVVTCTLTKKSGEEFSSAEEPTISAKFVEPDKGTDDAPTAYGTAVGAGCFEYVSAAVADKKLSDDKLTITFTVTITYKWGSIFGGENPFDYYNGSYEVTEGDETKTVQRESSGKCGVAIPKIDNYEAVAETHATWADHANYYLRVLAAIQSTASYSLTIAAAPAAA